MTCPNCNREIPGLACEPCLTAKIERQRIATFQKDQTVTFKTAFRARRVHAVLTGGGRRGLALCGKRVNSVNKLGHARQRADLSCVVTCSACLKVGEVEAQNKKNV
jgi:hypothetical protein